MSQSNQDILVSIRCLAYNQECYIRQTLDGFVMQQTNFRFEAVVHDDASTDGTAAIIKEYATRYPDIIKPIFETENRYSKHDGSLGRIMNEACTGKYIACCEGDDYWTDPLKLQKQVDILEANPSVSMVHTAFKNVDSDSREIVREDYEQMMKRSHTGNVLCDLFQGNYILTLTTCCRREVFSSPFFQDCSVSLDYCIFMTAASMGDIYYLPDVTGCYRLNPQGMMHTIANVVNNIIFQIRIYFGIRIIRGEINRLSPQQSRDLAKTLILDAWLWYKMKGDAQYVKALLREKPTLSFTLAKHLLRVALQDVKSLMGKA